MSYTIEPYHEIHMFMFTQTIDVLSKSGVISECHFDESSPIGFRGYKSYLQLLQSVFEVVLLFTPQLIE